MINKKAAADLTVRKLILWILGIIVLVLLVVGVIMGLHTPIFKTVGSMYDSVLITFGLRSEAPINTKDCFTTSSSFELESGAVEHSVFKQCIFYELNACELYDFSDGSHYFFDAETSHLRVKRDDSAAYDVDVTFEENDEVTESDVFYSSVTHLYQSYGVDPSGRRNDFDVYNYIKNGMDKDFGEFGEMLILYSPDNQIYLMSANGLYLVYSLELLQDDGLSTIEALLSRGIINSILGGGSVVSTPNPGIITPLLGSEEDDWIYYIGNNENDALDEFNARSSAAVGETLVTNPSYSVEYAICDPKSSNSIYSNCHIDKTARESGDISVFISNVYAESPQYFTTPPKADGIKFSVDAKKFVQIYFQIERARTLSGIKSANTLDTINVNIDSFELKGEEYALSARRNQFELNSYFPIVVISKGSEELYFLKFNGVERYFNNDVEFFISKGNQIKSPFGLYEARSGIEIEVDREFSQSDFEDELDRLVYDFMLERCI